MYAWALMPIHLLVRTGIQPLSTSMRRLITGYVMNFNLRHRRHGHLFQNRYKSIVCEDDPYLLELTRYIHLNPVRAGMLKRIYVFSIEELNERERRMLRLSSKVSDLTSLAKRIPLMRGLRG